MYKFRSFRVSEKSLHMSITLHNFPLFDTPMPKLPLTKVCAYFLLNHAQTEMSTHPSIYFLRTQGFTLDAAGVGKRSTRSETQQAPPLIPSGTVYTTDDLTLICRNITDNNYNICHAAKICGLERTKLQKLVQKYRKGSDNLRAINSTSTFVLPPTSSGGRPPMIDPSLFLSLREELLAKQVSQKAVRASSAEYKASVLNLVHSAQVLNGNAPTAA